MDDTPNLKLPYIVAAQAQKHVTHNEAIRALDALVHLSILDRDLTTPPATPADGERYLVATSATGEWAGHDGEIAAFQDGAWAYYPPGMGYVAWISDESTLVAWSGAAWFEISGGEGGGSVNPTPLVGVNATADTSNRLSVNAPAVLFNHEGAGHQVKINKNSVSDTGSVLFQSSFSGRAEMGLTGDDDFHFKVSADGSSWFEAIAIDKGTGVVSFPNSPAGGLGGPNFLINGDGQINQRKFAGGALSGGTYGYDRWKGDTGGVTVSVDGLGVWTLTSGALVQVIEADMWGSLGDQVVTLSIENLEGGDIDADVGSQSGTITSGSGQRSITFTLAPGDSGDVDVKLTPASGAVTFERVKLERGSSATPWVKSNLMSELSLAQRYYRKTYRQIHAPGQATSSGQLVARDIATGTIKEVLQTRFDVPMRTSPTVTWYSPITGTIDTIVESATDRSVVATLAVSDNTPGYPQLAATGGGLNTLWRAHFTADAEL